MVARQSPSGGPFPPSQPPFGGPFPQLSDECGTPFAVVVIPVDEKLFVRRPTN